MGHFSLLNRTRPRSGGPRWAANRSTTWRSWSQRRGRTVGGRTRPGPCVGAACFQLPRHVRAELRGLPGEGQGPSLSTSYKPVCREDGDGICDRKYLPARKALVRARTGLHLLGCSRRSTPVLGLLCRESGIHLVSPPGTSPGVTVVTVVSTEARDQRPCVQLEGGQRGPLPWERELNFRPHTNQPGLLGLVGRQSW